MIWRLEQYQQWQHNSVLPRLFQHNPVVQCSEMTSLYNTLLKQISDAWFKKDSLEK